MALSAERMVFSIGCRRNALFMVLSSLAVVGCGGASPSVNQNIPRATTSAVATIASGGGTVLFPVAAGYGGSFEYSANNVSGAVTAALQTTTVIPAFPGPPPRGTPIVAFEFKLTHKVTFVKWYSLLSSIVVPPSAVATSHSFGEYGYDLTTGVQMGWNQGTVSGNSITFSGGLGPVTLDTHMYLYVLFET